MMVVDDSNAVADLQKIASAFSPALPAAHTVTLQVVLVAGAKHAWRLVETVRSSGGRPRRHMLCFDSVEQIQRAIDGYLAWQRADERFVATHMATPGDFAGVTTDWVPSTQFELFFGSVRDSIRSDLRPTSAQCTVSLPPH